LRNHRTYKGGNGAAKDEVVAVARFDNIADTKIDPLKAAKAAALAEATRILAETTQQAAEKINRAEGKGKTKGKSAKPEGCKSIVVKGLAFAATKDDLMSTFKRCGKRGPQNVKILTDKSGESKGIAFVDFDDEHAVDEAMLLTQTELKGRRFFLDYALPRKR